MSFSYNKLWILLIEKKMKKMDLAKIANITGTTIAKMGRGEPVNLSVIAKICRALNVNVGDLVDYRRDELEDGEKQK